VVDADRFAPGPADAGRRAELGIADDEAVLGFCGELRHKKGLPFLLDALGRVRRERPACLLVIGDVRPREQAAISRFALESPEDAERILVTGHTEDPDEVARDLRQCDVVLQPSVWDGLPNAVLEAMACARPVVASDAGGIPEAVEHGKSGLLLPKAGLHRLGETVLEVLSMPEADREAMGAAARQAVIDGFGPERERRSVAEILARLRQRPSRSS
jgi:glycosyltransferase involved in cell wall biosynthesis